MIGTLDNNYGIVYKASDLFLLKPFVNTARELWKDASRKEFDKRGDEGSCIMGDGIFIYLVPARCRKPVRYTLIDSHEVSFAQGSLHYEATKDVALNFLKQNGIDAQYDYGRMD